jgi:hypothetical protein
MALTDIHFQEGESMDFIVERAVGTSNPAVDILVEDTGSQFLLVETPLVIAGGGGGNIFIMSE